MKMSDQAQVSIGAVSTGSLSLDLALGIGGLPRGRIVEIFGPESSGKTTLVYHVIAEAQRRGGICAFIDAEHAMDPTYAKRIGVDIDDLLVSQPDTGEQALEIAELLVRSGALDVVAVDSVAALTPKAEIEGEMGDSHVGLQARLMSQALRKLAGTLNRTDTICLFTNQLREKIGVMFGSPETTPGGRALKFYASVRLDIRRIETLKEGVGGDRQPRPREGGEEQGRAAVQAGRVRHHLRLRDLLGGHRPRRRARAEDRPEVGLVLQLRRRAARPGPAERDGVPREHPDVVQQILAAHPGRGSATEQVASARLLPSGGAAPTATTKARTRGGRRGRRSRRRPARGASSPRSAAAGRRSRSSSTAPWRALPLDAVVRDGLRVGLELDRPRLREAARERRRPRRRLRGREAARARDLAAAELDDRLERAGGRRSGGDRRALERAGLVDDARVRRRNRRRRSPPRLTATPRSATISSGAESRRGGRARRWRRSSRSASARSESSPSAAGRPRRRATSRASGFDEDAVELLRQDARAGDRMSVLHPTFFLQRGFSESQPDANDHP